MNPIRKTASFARRHKNIGIFVLGFLFDAFTTRIDSWIDLTIQFTYLSALTVLLILQYRHQRGRWTPSGKAALLWRYNVEILHFVYGGLLSVYVIIYFKSGAGNQLYVFLSMMVGLFIFNEMPQIRRISYRLYLGLYSFALCSYLIYLVPIIAGTLGTGVFLVSVGISAALVGVLTGTLVRREQDRHRTFWRLFSPALAVFALLISLYHLQMIPPVPLSIHGEGLFHHVEKTGDGYILRSPKPAWHEFWKDESDPFLARSGDAVYYFVRIFAPPRFKHGVFIRWAYRDPRTGTYITSDRLPMAVVGGREKGFRGYAFKTNYHPGDWRVIMETSDGRAIGIKDFKIIADDSTSDRRWKTSRS
ncbi:MAG TPA: DUF2914 domain-containing protein [Elusimicrobiota bacterium]|nr:DUF2914 domain-containing protein [Elusimicrobiota bacterium]